MTKTFWGHAVLLVLAMGVGGTLVAAQRLRYFVPVMEARRSGIETIEGGYDSPYMVHFLLHREVNVCVMVIRHMPTEHLTAVIVPVDACRFD